MKIANLLKLNLVERASELMENHDLDNDDFNYLMNKGNNKRYNFVKLEPLYFHELTEKERDGILYDVNSCCSCGWCEGCLNAQEQEAHLRNSDFFKLGEIVYCAHECERSNSENLVGVWPISNNSALGLVYIDDNCAVVTYL